MCPPPFFLECLILRPRPASLLCSPPPRQLPNKSESRQVGKLAPVTTRGGGAHPQLRSPAHHPPTSQQTNKSESRKVGKHAPLIRLSPPRAVLAGAVSFTPHHTPPDPCTPPPRSMPPAPLRSPYFPLPVDLARPRRPTHFPPAAPALPQPAPSTRAGCPSFSPYPAGKPHHRLRSHF